MKVATIKKHLLLRKKWLIIFGVLFLIIATVGIYLNRILEKKLDKALREAVVKASKGLYKIDFQEVDVNVFTGSAGLSAVNLQVDTVMYAQMAKQQILPRQVYDVQASALELSRINLLKAYFSHSLALHKILLENPAVKLIQVDTLLSKNLPPINHETLYQKISKHLKYIDLDELSIQHLKLNYLNQHSGTGIRTVSIEDLQLNLDDIRIDSLTQHDENRLGYAKKVSASIQNFKAHTADSLYSIKIDEFTGSSESEQARITGLSVDPRYPEMEFSAQFKEQRSRYAFSAQEIVLSKLNYYLLKSKFLNASDLSITEAKMNIFLNRTQPKPYINRDHTFPGLALKQLPLNLLIDSVHIKDSKLGYTEYNPNSQGKGTVLFENVKGEFSHVTNDSTAIQKDRFFKADLSCLFMGAGDMAFKFRFDLLDPKGGFTFSSNLGKMAGESFNPVLKPLALTQVAKGQINSISFAGKGNTHFCEGDITPQYSGLRISILEKDPQKPGLKKKAIISLFTNVLLLRSDNPDQDGKLHSTHFLYTRFPDGAFFNTIWRGVSSGMIENIGLGMMTRKRVKNWVNQMQEQKAQRKQRRQERASKRKAKPSVPEILK